MNKRGISPLVATLVLISFAIALGIVIMTFGRAQVELEAQCAIDVGLDFLDIGGIKHIDYDPIKKELAFTIENGINIKNEGLIVKVIGSKRVETFELDDADIIKAGTYRGKVSYDNAVSGDVRQVKIIPKILLYDREQICINKALVTHCAVDIGLNAERICYDPAGKGLAFTIENGANARLEGLIVNIIGTHNAETFEIKVNIAKNGEYIDTIKYDSTTSGKIRKVKITPKAIINDEKLICAEKALVIEDVKDC